MVVIGRDGLIVTRGPYSGLLLPQVAPEWGFDSLEFLSQTCVKAGLPPDAWLDEDTMVEHFQAQIFAEVAPGREVFEKKLPGGVGGDVRDLKYRGSDVVSSQSPSENSLH